MRQKAIATWKRFHEQPALLRWSLKGLFLGLVIVLCLYPRFWLIPRWIHRLQHMNDVVDPHHPGLRAWDAALRERVAADLSPSDKLLCVERLIRERIPYAWDWETWGVMDYLPTTGEVLALGREDCDGRAVLAASLLRRMGIEAYLVSDLKHTWVETPEGEVMSPGKGQKTLRATKSGTRARVNRETARNLARGLAFGVVVFPLHRELIILAALFAVTAHPRMRRGHAVFGAALLVGGLLLFRGAGVSPVRLAGQPLLVWVGLGVAVAGWMMVALRAGDRRWRRVAPESRAAGDVCPD